MTAEELIQVLEKCPQQFIVVADTGEGEAYEIRAVRIRNDKIYLDE